MYHLYICLEIGILQSSLHAIWSCRMGADTCETYCRSAHPNIPLSTSQMSLSYLGAGVLNKQGERTNITVYNWYGCYIFHIHNPESNSLYTYLAKADSYSDFCQITKGISLLTAVYLQSYKKGSL